MGEILRRVIVGLSPGIRKQGHMKLLSLVLGGLGLIAALLAAIGRFFGPSVVYLFGDSFSSATLLHVSSILLTMGVFVRLLTLK